MFDRELEVIAATVEVEVGIAPPMQVTGAAQGLTGTIFPGGLFRMMDQHDGEMKAALQITQERKDRSDFRSVIFVNAMQPDKRVEDKQAGAKGPYGGGETLPVAVLIEV